MHTYVSTLKKETKGLKDSKGKALTPTKVIKLAGFSDANWYNWTGGRSNPSDEMQKKITETLQKIKATQATAAPTLNTVPSAPAGEKTLNQMLQERHAAKAKLDSEIAAIMNVMELAA